MKKILIANLLSILTQVAISQVSWFPTGATWTYDVSWFGGEALVKLEILPEDTFFNGQVYKIMKATSIQNIANEDIYTTITFRYVYEESNKIFSGNELLYDFNRQVGDTLEYMYFGGLSPSPFIVDSIDILEMNGILFQFQDIRFPNLYDPNAEWWEMRVLEGIGSISTFFFWDQTIIQPSDAPFYYIRCYEDSQVGTIHFNPAQLDCDALPWTTSLSETGTIEASIFPNPANTSIHLQLSEPAYTTISIMDVYGRALLQINTEGSTEIESDISHLAEGLYFLCGLTSDGTIQYSGKFLKRN